MSEETELLGSRKRKFTTGKTTYNKKQKINDYQTVEITEKTIHAKPSQDKPPFGPKDINLNINEDEENFFISNDDIFEKLKEKESQKYLSIIQSKNHKNIPPQQQQSSNNKQLDTDNLSLADLLCSNEGTRIEDEESENSDSNNIHNHLFQLCQENSLTTHCHDSDDNNNEMVIGGDNDDGDDNDDNNNEFMFPPDYNECFLCSWGNSAHDGIYSHHLEELKRIYTTFRAYAPEEELANMLFSYYKENVYIPDRGMPMLTPIMALNHIRNIGKCHTLNAPEHVINSIRNWSKVSDNLLFTMFHKNNKIDKDQFNCFEKAQKIIDSLYLRDINKMNFRDADCRINITNGPIFKRESINENLEKIIKTNKTTQLNITKGKTINI